MSLSAFDLGLQVVRAGFAQNFGQTFSLYRLSSSTNGSVVSGSPVIAEFPAEVVKASKKDIEDTTFDLLLMEATCDNRLLQSQDVLVQNGYENDGSVFTFVQNRPPHSTLFIRTESACQITRPTPAAGQAAQAPQNWNVALPGWSGTPKDSDQILTLANGQYAFAPSGATAATVYCGLQPLNRLRDGQALNIPTERYRDHMLLYVPLLGSINVRMRDRIHIPATGDAFQIAQIFLSGSVGVSGTICVVENLGIT